MSPWLWVIGGGFAGLLIFRYVIARVTVFEFERGLSYRKGRYRRVLEPGQHWYMPFFTTIKKVDVRLRSETVPGQEVLSADSISLKVSLATQYKIADPARATNSVQDVDQAVYQELQLALRAVVGSATADELLAKRGEMPAQLLDRTRERAAELGVELSLVSVKDIMFPGELKKMFAQIVKAKKEGQAALERARGESAALRSLANAARIVANNPALMHLRTLQTLGEGSGHTVVLGMPGHGMPYPFGRGDDPSNGNGNGNGESA